MLIDKRIQGGFHSCQVVKALGSEGQINNIIIARYTYIVNIYFQGQQWHGQEELGLE